MVFWVAIPQKLNGLNLTCIIILIHWTTCIFLTIELHTAMAEHLVDNTPIAKFIILYAFLLLY